MKTTFTIAILSLAIGLTLQARAADECADLFWAKPAPVVSSYEVLKAEIERKVSLFENHPRFVLRSSTNYDQILLMTELASLSGRKQEQIGNVIDGVPSVTFQRTTSYPTRIRIATLSALSGKSISETIAMMSSVPAIVRNYRISSETYSTIVELAAISGREPADLARAIEQIPDVTLGKATSWPLRLWFVKIGVLAGHSSFAETEALIRSVPKSIFNYRISSETLSAIVELSAATGVRPVEIVKVIESVPNSIWARTTSFDTRMWVAKLAVLSGKTPAQIETMGNAFPRYVFRRTASPEQFRFVMSLNAVGQNKKAFGLIDRPAPPEPEMGFWEALARYLFE